MSYYKICIWKLAKKKKKGKKYIFASEIHVHLKKLLFEREATCAKAYMNFVKWHKANKILFKLILSQIRVTNRLVK